MTIFNHLLWQSTPLLQFIFNSSPRKIQVKSEINLLTGETIRLSKQLYDKWRESFRAIPDLRADLLAADDYYTENPPRDRKWFFPVSRWLAKANADATTRKEQANYGRSQAGALKTSSVKLRPAAC